MGLASLKEKQVLNEARHQQVKTGSSLRRSDVWAEKSLILRRPDGAMVKVFERIALQPPTNGGVGEEPYVERGSRTDFLQIDPPFRLRNYVASVRLRENLNRSWPFSQKFLRSYLDQGKLPLLPPLDLPPRQPFERFSFDNLLAELEAFRKEEEEVEQRHLLRPEGELEKPGSLDLKLGFVGSRLAQVDLKSIAPKKYRSERRVACFHESSLEVGERGHTEKLQGRLQDVTRRLKDPLAGALGPFVGQSCGCSRKSRDVAEEVERGGKEAFKVGQVDPRVSEDDVEITRFQQQDRREGERRVLRSRALTEEDEQVICLSKGTLFSSERLRRIGKGNPTARIEGTCEPVEVDGVCVRKELLVCHRLLQVEEVICSGIQQGEEDPHIEVESEFIVGDERSYKFVEDVQPMKSGETVRLGKQSGPVSDEDDCILEDEVLCPVCNKFSSSSHTTMNVHIDNCLMGKNQSKAQEKPAPPSMVAKPKVRKKRSMADICAAAPTHMLPLEENSRYGEASSDLSKQSMDQGGFPLQHLSQRLNSQWVTEIPIKRQPRNKPLRCFSENKRRHLPRLDPFIEDTNLGKQRKRRLPEKEAVSDRVVSKSKQLRVDANVQRLSRSNSPKEAAGSDVVNMRSQEIAVSKTSEFATPVCQSRSSCLGSGNENHSGSGESGARTANCVEEGKGMSASGIRLILQKKQLESAGAKPHVLSLTKNYSPLHENVLLRDMHPTVSIGKVWFPEIASDKVGTPWYPPAAMFHSMRSQRTLLEEIEEKYCAARDMPSSLYEMSGSSFQVPPCMTSPSNATVQQVSKAFSISNCLPSSYSEPLRKYRSTCETAVNKINQLENKGHLDTVINDSPCNIISVGNSGINQGPDIAMVDNLLNELHNQPPSSASEGENQGTNVMSDSVAGLGFLRKQKVSEMDVIKSMEGNGTSEVEGKSFIEKSVVLARTANLSLSGSAVGIGTLETCLSGASNVLPGPTEVQCEVMRFLIAEHCLEENLGKGRRDGLVDFVYDSQDGPPLKQQRLVAEGTKVTTSTKMNLSTDQNQQKGVVLKESNVDREKIQEKIKVLDLGSPCPKVEGELEEMYVRRMEGLIGFEKTCEPVVNHFIAGSAKTMGSKTPEMPRGKEQIPEFPCKIDELLQNPAFEWVSGLSDCTTRQSLAEEVLQINILGFDVKKIDPQAEETQDHAKAAVEDAIQQQSLGSYVLSHRKEIKQKVPITQYDNAGAVQPAQRDTTDSAPLAGSNSNYGSSFPSILEPAGNQTPPQQQGKSTHARMCLMNMQSDIPSSTVGHSTGKWKSNFVVGLISSNSQESPSSVDYSTNFSLRKSRDSPVSERSFPPPAGSESGEWSEFRLVAAQLADNSTVSFESMSNVVGERIDYPALAIIRKPEGFVQSEESVTDQNEGNVSDLVLVQTGKEGNPLSSSTKGVHLLGDERGTGSPKVEESSSLVSTLDYCERYQLLCQKPFWGAKHAGSAGKLFSSLVDSDRGGASKFNPKKSPHTGIITSDAVGTEKLSCANSLSSESICSDSVVVRNVSCASRAPHTFDRSRILSGRCSSLSERMLEPAVQGRSNSAILLQRFASALPPGLSTFSNGVDRRTSQVAPLGPLTSLIAMIPTSAPSSNFTSLLHFSSLPSQTSTLSLQGTRPFQNNGEDEKAPSGNARKPVSPPKNIFRPPAEMGGPIKNSEFVQTSAAECVRTSGAEDPVTGDKCNSRLPGWMRTAMTELQSNGESVDTILSSGQVRARTEASEVSKRTPEMDQNSVDVNKGILRLWGTDMVVVAGHDQMANISDSQPVKLMEYSSRIPEDADPDYLELYGTSCFGGFQVNHSIFNSEDSQADSAKQIWQPDRAKLAIINDTNSNIAMAIDSSEAALQNFGGCSSQQPDNDATQVDSDNLRPLHSGYESVSMSVEDQIDNGLIPSTAGGAPPGEVIVMDDTAGPPEKFLQNLTIDNLLKCGALRILPQTGLLHNGRAPSQLMEVDPSKIPYRLTSNSLLADLRKIGLIPAPKTSLPPQYRSHGQPLSVDLSGSASPSSITRSSFDMLPPWLLAEKKRKEAQIAANLIVLDDDEDPVDVGNLARGAGPNSAVSLSVRGTKEMGLLTKATASASLCSMPGNLLASSLFADSWKDMRAIESQRLENPLGAWKPSASTTAILGPALPPSQATPTRRSRISPSLASNVRVGVALAGQEVSQNKGRRFVYVNQGNAVVEKERMSTTSTHEDVAKEMRDPFAASIEQTAGQAGPHTPPLTGRKRDSTTNKYKDMQEQVPASEVEKTVSRSKGDIGGRKQVFSATPTPGSTQGISINKGVSLLRPCNGWSKRGAAAQACRAAVEKLKAQIKAKSNLDVEGWSTHTVPSGSLDFDSHMNGRAPTLSSVSREKDVASGPKHHTDPLPPIPLQAVFTSSFSGSVGGQDNDCHLKENSNSGRGQWPCQPHSPALASLQVAGIDGLHGFLYSQSTGSAAGLRVNSSSASDFTNLSACAATSKQAMTNTSVADKPLVATESPCVELPVSAFCHLAQPGPCSHTTRLGEAEAMQFKNSSHMEHVSSLSELAKLTTLSISRLSLPGVSSAASSSQTLPEEMPSFSNATASAYTTELLPGWEGLQDSLAKLVHGDCSKNCSKNTISSSVHFSSDRGQEARSKAIMDASSPTQVQCTTGLLSTSSSRRSPDLEVAESNKVVVSCIYEAGSPADPGITDAGVQELCRTPVCHAAMSMNATIHQEFTFSDSIAGPGESEGMCHSGCAPVTGLGLFECGPGCRVVSKFPPSRGPIVHSNTPRPHATGLFSNGTLQLRGSRMYSTSIQGPLLLSASEAADISSSSASVYEGQRTEDGHEASPKVFYTVLE